MNDAERLQFMERQLDRLSRERADALAALDRASSLGRLESAYAKLGDPLPIFRETLERVGEMIALKAAVFYAVDEEDGDFVPALTVPEEAGPDLVREVDALIADQSFALALRTRSPTFFLGSDRHVRLMLHPLSTPSRTRGMFVARLGQDKASISDITLALFTIVMNTCAMALESYELYRYFVDANRGLERTVAERTREMREAHDQMRTMLQASHDAMIMIDSDDRIRFWSPRAEEMFGHAEEEVLGGRLHELIAARDQDVEEARKGLEHFAFSGTGPVLGTVMEFLGKRKDGSVFPVERSVASLELNGKWHAVGSLRDITVRKQAEEELLRLNQELAERKAALEEDLRMAAEVQERLLPEKAVSLEGLEVDWRFRPSASIGGDIFNLLALPDGKAGAYVLDVSGHGAQAALVTLSVSQFLEPQGGVLVRDGRSAPPMEVVRSLEETYPLERFDKFFSFLYLTIDLRTGRLEYANAGHPPPLHMGAEGVRVLEQGGTVIGLGGPFPEESEPVALAPGDVLLLYTDACLEHEDPSGEPFGLDRLRDALGCCRGEHVDAILDEVYSRIMAFGQGRELDDDITLLCIKYLG